MHEFKIDSIEIRRSMFQVGLYQGGLYKQIKEWAIEGETN